MEAALEEAYQALPPRDGIVDVAKQQLQEAIDFVIEHDIVEMPEEPVEIIVMPEFQRGVSLAYLDPPGPLDRDQPAFYAVAPLPEDWTDDGATLIYTVDDPGTRGDIWSHDAEANLVPLTIEERRATLALTIERFVEPRRMEQAHPHSAVFSFGGVYSEIEANFEGSYMNGAISAGPVIRSSSKATNTTVRSSTNAASLFITCRRS